MKKLKFKLGARVMVTIFGKEMGAGTVVKIFDRADVNKPYLVEVDGMDGESWYREENLKKLQKGL